MRKPDEGSSDTLGLPGGVRSALRASAAGPDLLRPLPHAGQRCNDGSVSRRWTASLIGVGVAVLLPGLPIISFVVSNRQAISGTWVAFLIPNVLLVLGVGVVACGIYLFATRPRSGPTR